MKVCAGCGLEKDLERFKPILRNGRSYRVGRCRDCENARDRERRSTPEAKAKLRDYHRNRWLLKPEAKSQAAAKHKEYYRANAQYYRDRAKWYHDTHWSHRLLASCQAAARTRRSRGRNCDCTITREFIEELWVRQHGRCYFTGVPLRKERDALDTVSVDRLEPSRGYEPGNVVLATKAANFAKTGHSEAEFRDYLDKIADSILANRKPKSAA